jgi:hypothetical protein
MRIQAGRGAIIAYTMPLWTVVFGWLMVGEPITRTRLAALALGLAGMVALIAPVAGTLWHAPAGTLLMLGAAAGWAIGTVLTKAQAWTIPTAVLTGWQVVLGGVPIALGAALRLLAAGSGDSRFDLAAASSAALLGLAYATLVGALFCHWAWFRLVAMLPAAVAAIGTLGIPIVGLFSSALILGEGHRGRGAPGPDPGRERAHPADERGLRRVTAAPSDTEGRPGSPASGRRAGPRATEAPGPYARDPRRCSGSPQETERRRGERTEPGNPGRHARSRPDGRISPLVKRASPRLC